MYQPKGKAGEYSAWAVNFYNGCPHECAYCYLRKGVLSHTMGGNIPQLKKCFNSSYQAITVFKKELDRNREAIISDGGLFFSFSTDPCVIQTTDLTWQATIYALRSGVPVKILTKCTDYIDADEILAIKDAGCDINLLAIGFTITGRDDLEPFASPTSERLFAMSQLHSAGIRTFASMEPVIDPDLSFNLMSGMVKFCDHFKVGLQSGKKYSPEELGRIRIRASEFIRQGEGFTVYFKKSIQPYIDAEILADPKCVGADFDIFKNQA